MIDIAKLKDWILGEVVSYRGTLDDQRSAIEGMSINGGSLSGSAVLSQSSQIIIRSNPGSVPGMPEFGVGVSSYLDFPTVDIDPLSSIIEDNISRFDPRISLDLDLVSQDGELVINLGGELDVVRISV